MTPEELAALQEKVGADAAKAMQKELDAYEVKMKKFAQEIVDQKGGITVAQFDEYKKSAETAFDAVKEISAKQGVSLAEIAMTLEKGQQATKSISQVFEEDKAELNQIKANGQGMKTYMVTYNKAGQPVMRAFDMTKADSASKAGESSAVITQQLDAATLIRVGAGAQIYGQFRNTSWVFDLCNTINASFTAGMPYVIWFDEQPKVGSSAQVAEGATKPSTQYSYILHSDTYKKEATIVGFSQEFQMDFSQLESDIMNKARIDVINRVNSAILPRIIAAAVPYSTELEFRGGTGAPSYIPNVNDYDAIAAMAAQVDNSTFGGFLANAAVMSTFKKYRMGITKNNQGSYINPPDVINNIAFVGNPAMAADAVLVGDLKQYNIVLRGGLIVKVGYNGTDFANNQYSVVLEQFYFDYISAARKVAIVSGPIFANVKNTLTDDQGS
jgi:hypothetical protein